MQYILKYRYIFVTRSNSVNFQILAKYFQDRHIFQCSTINSFFVHVVLFKELKMHSLRSKNEKKIWAQNMHACLFFFFFCYYYYYQNISGLIDLIESPAAQRMESSASVIHTLICCRPGVYRYLCTCVGYVIHGWVPRSWVQSGFTLNLNFILASKWPFEFFYSCIYVDWAAQTCHHSLHEV